MWSFGLFHPGLKEMLRERHPDSSGAPQGEPLNSYSATPLVQALVDKHSRLTAEGAAEGVEDYHIDITGMSKSCMFYAQ